ncbi:MAG: HEAT repeat domain-containing protein [Deltaproteobacteria bacterium]|nr:HEAT repeat domain-containing protein [Deltaproteobacteria bacterium]
MIAIAAAPALAQPAGKAPAKKGTGVTLNPALVADLSGTDVERAAKAAEDLGANVAPAAHEALLNALALGLPPAVAAPAMTALGQRPAPPDVAALRRYAGHHTPGVRIAALTTLAIYPDPAAHAAIIAGLRDPVGMVRTAAAGAAGKGRVKGAVEPLLVLLAKGEDSSARALAQLADPALARQLADQLGKVPETTLAIALGTILKRADFGPDEARVEIVRAIAKIQDKAAVNALQDYLDSSPKTPPRTSRTEAQMVIEARHGGGK